MLQEVQLIGKSSAAVAAAEHALNFLEANDRGSTVYGHVAFKALFPEEIHANRAAAMSQIFFTRESIGSLEVFGNIAQSFAFTLRLNYDFLIFLPKSFLKIIDFDFSENLLLDFITLPSYHHLRVLSYCLNKLFILNNL